MSKSALAVLAVCFSLFFASEILAQKAFDGPSVLPLERESSYAAPNDPTLPEWAKMMYSDDPSMPDVIAAYKSYFQKNTFVKSAHTQFYKRWVRANRRFIEPKSGKIRQPSVGEWHRGYDDFLAKKAASENRSPTSDWSCIGPFDFDKGAAGQSHAPGAAHVYTIERAATDANILVVGTSTAGIWRSANGGTSWSCISKSLNFGSCAALKIDVQNPSIIWVGGGGKIFKTTDAGATWSTVGGTTFNSQSHDVEDIVQHPSNALILMVATNRGLYRSTDGGATLTQVVAAGGADDYFGEIEFKPGDPTTIYAVLNGVSDLYTAFYKSTNTGASFSVSATWPVQSNTLAAGDHQKRAEIAVTASAPDRIYALLAGKANGGEGLYGVYRSDDSGGSWAHVCCGTGPGGTASASNPNLLGYSETSDGGQYYYDLTLSATGADEVHLGGVEHWYSINGGAAWTNTANWSTPADPQYIHADIHDMKNFGQELWVACDGGLFYSTDGGKTTAFDKRQNGIAATDFWGFGAGWQDGSVMLGGTYHNSHLMKNGNVYTGGWVSYTGSADGVRGFVNPGKEKVVYNDGGREILSNNRTVAPSTYSFEKKPNATYLPGESCDLEWDAHNYNLIYSAVDGQVWKTEDDGASWTLFKDFGAVEVFDFEVAASNSQIMFATVSSGFYDDKVIWKTIDGGQNWSNITPTNAQTNNNNDLNMQLEVSATDANLVWLILVHSYNWTAANGYKIFKSTNGGTTWTNWTTATLDGESASDIRHQIGTDGGVYLGTTNGVFYRNNAMADWAVFSNQLPAATNCTRILPYYKGEKIRNATTRSVWENDFYEPSQPVAFVGVDKTNSSCSRDTFYFSNRSVQSATSASQTWAFSPAPTWISSLTEASPKAVFAPGTYSVTLTISDANGSDSEILPNFLTVSSGCDVDTLPGKSLVLDGTGDYAVASGNMNLNSNTVTISAWIKPDGAQNDWAGIAFARGGTTTAGVSLKSNNEIRYHWNDGGYGFSSGLIAPDGVWSHVVLAVSPTNVKIYLNGIAATNTTAIAAEEFNAPLQIGFDNGSRYFKGQIDEVAVYDRTLTQNEIRELQHLTRSPADDADLISYYQMNETTGQILDRVASRHCSMSGNAARATSSAPVGKGTSERKSVLNPTTYGFGNAFLTLAWPSGATVPSGEVCVTRLTQTPDASPNSTFSSGNGYWIINNYGTNASFTQLQNITFSDWGNIAAGSSAANFKMYKRSSFAESQASWQLLDDAENIGTGAHAFVNFSTGNAITSFSQFVVLNQNAVLPVELTHFSASKMGEKKVLLEWTTASENNSAGFEIERSLDGSRFEKIGFIASGCGTCSEPNLYQFIDNQPFTGLNFYRLKTIDLDGAAHFSEIKTVDFDEKKTADLWPNPARSDGQLFFKANFEDDFSIQIFDVSGRLVFEKKAEKSESFGLEKGLPSGQYFFKIEGATFRKAGRLSVE